MMMYVQSSDSHGVYDDADDDQGGSTKMMIYYEKQKMMMQITGYDASFSYHEIDTTYDCFCNLMS